jgi:hypothetical protein
VVTGSNNIQDTIKPRFFSTADSLPQNSDSLKINPGLQVQQPHDGIYGVIAKPPILKTVPESALTAPSDTVCLRNHFSHITFTDSTSLLYSLDTSVTNSFAWYFPREMDAIVSERKFRSEKALREGAERQSGNPGTDWAFPLMLFILLLFGVVRWSSASVIKSMTKFFSFRGINDPSSRDTAGLFYWQSTVSNLGAFLSVSLFCWAALNNYGISLFRGPSVLLWAACLVLVLISVSLRHGINILVGSLSEQADLFKEYTVTVYDAYRTAGTLLVLFSVMALYIEAVSPDISIMSGFICAAAIYSGRVIRLFLIFITRHVPIVYLILYLCALEILPVLVLVKYFTGLA